MNPARAHDNIKRVEESREYTLHPVEPKSYLKPLRARGPYDESRKVINKVLEVDPTVIEALALLGDIEEKKGDISAALSAYINARARRSSGNLCLRGRCSGSQRC